MVVSRPAPAVLPHPYPLARRLAPKLENTVSTGLGTCRAARHVRQVSVTPLSPSLHKIGGFVFSAPAAQSPREDPAGAPRAGRLQPQDPGQLPGRSPHARNGYLPCYQRQDPRGDRFPHLRLLPSNRVGSSLPPGKKRNSKSVETKFTKQSQSRKRTVRVQPPADL